MATLHDKQTATPRQRDMSREQFAAALVRYGMRESGFMGYVNINVPGHHIEVSKFNAGSRRREQLVYLLCKRDAAMRECYNCGRIFEDHHSLQKDENGKLHIVRLCPDNKAEQFVEAQ